MLTWFTDFRRPHAAEEVYVTGTFDNWSKSEKLEKVGDHFEKIVTLAETGDSIFYKVCYPLLLPLNTSISFPHRISPAQQSHDARPADDMMASCGGATEDQAQWAIVPT